MKKLILALWICLGLFSFGYSQSSDEKIADAMNNSDWFALDSLYQTEPRDSISDFLEIFFNFARFTLIPPAKSHIIKMTPKERRSRL